MFGRFSSLTRSAKPEPLLLRPRVFPQLPRTRLIPALESSSDASKVRSSERQVTSTEALDTLGRALVEGESAEEYEQVALAALTRFTLLTSHRGLAESQQALESAKRAVLRCGDRATDGGVARSCGPSPCATQPPERGRRRAPVGLGSCCHRNPTRLSRPSQGWRCQEPSIFWPETTRPRTGHGRLGTWPSPTASSLFKPLLKPISRFSNAGEEIFRRRRHWPVPPSWRCLEFRWRVVPSSTPWPTLPWSLVIFERQTRRFARSSRLSLGSAGRLFCLVDSAPVRARLASTQGDLDAAHSVLSHARDAADARGDVISWAKLTLLRSEVCCSMNDGDGADADTVSVVERIRHPTTEVLGLLARAHATRASCQGDRKRFLMECSRAVRVFAASGDRFHAKQTISMRRALANRDWPIEGRLATRQHRLHFELAENLSFVCGLLPQPQIAATEAIRLLKRMRVITDAFASQKSGPWQESESQRGPW